VHLQRSSQDSHSSRADDKPLSEHEHIKASAARSLQWQRNETIEGDKSSFERLESASLKALAALSHNESLTPKDAGADEFS
jgi:hypothetical protein